MTIKIDTSLRDMIVDNITSYLGSGTLKIYTGAQPASPNDAATGTLLVTLDISQGVFSSSSNGQASLSGAPTMPSATAVATGTAGWFRWEDGLGTYAYDGSVTATGGGGDAEINSTAITGGDTVDLTAFTVSMPEG